MRLDEKELSLYAVTDRSWLFGETLEAQVQKALKGGITMLQLREKNMPKEAFLEEAVRMKELCKNYRVPLIINDDVQIAKSVDADGVHVGQGDMDVKTARRILGADKIVGVSAHNIEEALRAEADGADYLGVGAVFGTSTKDDAGRLEHEMLEKICSAVKIPVVAIGGISKENIIALKGRGISGVAVVSAIFAQPDIESAARKLKETLYMQKILGNGEENEKGSNL